LAIGIGIADVVPFSVLLELLNAILDWFQAKLGLPNWAFADDILDRYL
jgi:hypothetical protein